MPAHFVSNEVPHAHVLDYLTQIDIHHLSREWGNNEQIRLIGLRMCICIFARIARTCEHACSRIRERYIDRDCGRLCPSCTRFTLVHRTHRRIDHHDASREKCNDINRWFTRQWICWITDLRIDKIDTPRNFLSSVSRLEAQTLQNFSVREESLAKYVYRLKRVQRRCFARAKSLDWIIGRGGDDLSRWK
jgi:hypothetical protein